MACELVKFGDTVAFLCGGRRRRQVCGFCHKLVATKLCDFDLGHGKTCDMPICDNCATHAGKDIDYCPWHKHAARQGELFQ